MQILAVCGQTVFFAIIVFAYDFYLSTQNALSTYYKGRTCCPKFMSLWKGEMYYINKFKVCAYVITRFETEVMGLMLCVHAETKLDSKCQDEQNYYYLVDDNNYITNYELCS